MEDNKKEGSIKTVVISGSLIIIGTILGGVIKGYMDIQLSERKLYSELILKSMESESPNERYESLKFMLEVKLIENSEIKNGLEKYIAKNKDSKSNIPRYKNSLSLSKVDLDEFKSLENNVESLKKQIKIFSKLKSTTSDENRKKQYIESMFNVERRKIYTIEKLEEKIRKICESNDINFEKEMIEGKNEKDVFLYRNIRKKYCH